MMTDTNIALLGSAFKMNLVYPEDRLQRLASFGNLSKEVITASTLEKHKDFLRNTGYIFSTWGMPSLTREQIQKYLPSLKAVFYAAGTVQTFAKPFLQCGVRVFSAARANGVPVAGYVFSQIMLANKGYFTASRKAKLNPLGAYLSCYAHTGNYEFTVGVIGAGVIGSMVCEKLKALDKCEILVYDKFLTQEKAEQLGVKLSSLENIFTRCDVITNHLANKKELKNILDYRLFNMMKPYATFINTGRGAQVSEAGLARVLLKRPGITALIDVTKTDIITPVSPLFWCRNAVCTPHIAGSTSNETHRMADMMIEDFSSLLDGKSPASEITADILERTA